MGGYTLGLDIGSNSIGWALIETGERPAITDMGVRVFPEGVDRDTKRLEKSKNATRREARGARRTHRRRSQRKQQLLNVLQTVGLLPKAESELPSLFHASPYELRKKGLDERLDPYEFGRVLYHLSQRRGFKSNRKSAKAKEDSVVIERAGALQGEIDNKKCRTIGEYFASLNADEQRVRGRYTFRSMYEKEFDLLWENQAKSYPETLTDELRQKIRDDIIFFQRPLKPADDLIGKCELQPNENRCPRADWYAREFRVLQDVNNLIIQKSDGSEQRLSQEQRQIIIDALRIKERLTFGKIRQKLGLLEIQRFNAEYRVGPGGKRVQSLKGDVFVWAMRGKNIFGPKGWQAMNERQKVELNTAFLELEDDELQEKLRLQYGLNEEQVKAAMKVSLPKGYMRFSCKAIQKLLPAMKEGMLTHEAIKNVYRDRSRGHLEEVAKKLDSPPELRNPIVQKALVEVRKVVNAIIREYGKPGKIKIEMARDVQGSKQEREELHWKQEENKKRNEQARKRLKEDIGIPNPTRDDVIKYKLWEECRKRCPYTGKTISQQALFGPNPEFQIEHILPYDRSLDDSYMNKTLCEVHENIHVKKNQTAYEAYSHDPEAYEQIKQNIKVLPWPKRRKFIQQEINLDTHIDRELNDTRYICRELVSYLKKLGVKARGTRGKITAELRHQWGLDGIFDELGTRRDDDHRRHAVDAVVVGVTENKHLRKLARSKYSMSNELFGQPWPAFRDEVREKVNRINVSHRVCRKVSGKLHEETNYGPTHKEGLYAFRKKLDDLTLPMVHKIVDPVVREIVKARLIEKGIGLADSGKPPKEVWKEPLYMKTTKSNRKVQINKVRLYNVAGNVIELKDSSGEPYRYVEPGNNHHIEIFQYKDKKGRTKRAGKVVSMFDAVKRSQRGEPVVRRDYGDGGEFVCSLAINEMFLMDMGDGNMELHRVQKIIHDGRIVLRPHTYSGKVADSDKPPLIQRKNPNTLKGHKVTVDMVGRVQLAND